jgi:hypothetical protein
MVNGHLKNPRLRFWLVKICNKSLCAPAQGCKTVAHASGSDKHALLTVAHASGSERYLRNPAHYKIFVFNRKDNIKRYLFYQACLRLPTYETS